MHNNTVFQRRDSVTLFKKIYFGKFRKVAVYKFTKDTTFPIESKGTSASSFFKYNVCYATFENG